MSGGFNLTRLPTEGFLTPPVFPLWKRYKQPHPEGNIVSLSDDTLKRLLTFEVLDDLDREFLAAAAKYKGQYKTQNELEYLVGRRQKRKRIKNSLLGLASLSKAQQTSFLEEAKKQALVSAKDIERLFKTPIPIPLKKEEGLPDLEKQPSSRKKTRRYAKKQKQADDEGSSSNDSSEGKYIPDSDYASNELFSEANSQESLDEKSKLAKEDYPEDDESQEDQWPSLFDPAQEDESGEDDDSQEESSYPNSDQRESPMPRFHIGKNVASPRYRLRSLGFVSPRPWTMRGERPKPRPKK